MLYVPCYDSLHFAELKKGPIESRCDTSIWRALPLDTGKRLTSLSIRFPPNRAKLKKSQQAALRWRTSARLSSISRTMVCRPAGGARQGYGRTAMRVKLLAITSLVASGVIVTAFFVQSLSSGSAQTQTRPRYLPEYTASGDLILPKNFHEWVYVGSPLTPNALNDGHAGFPEYHNVYIEPGSYEIYKRTNEFPERTILAATHAAGAEPRRFANRAFGEGLFPRTFQWRRCDRQGYQALCRYRRMGVLRFQSS